jgi:primosomal replication protein N
MRCVPEWVLLFRKWNSCSGVAILELVLSFRKWYCGTGVDIVVWLSVVFIPEGEILSSGQKESRKELELEIYGLERWDENGMVCNG